MADSATHWCTLCLAERGIQTPVQVDWPRIPICFECAAATADRVRESQRPISHSRSFRLRAID